VVDALDDGLAVAADGDGALGAVGEHLTGHLHAGSRHLPHLLDLGPALAYEGAALAGGHHQPEGDGGPRHRARADQAVQVLIKFVANKCKCLKNGFSVAGNSDDPLGTASITDVDLCTTLLSKSFHNVSFLSNYASNFFSLHDEPDSEGHVGARLGSLGAGLVSCRHGGGGGDLGCGERG